jgi:hypothetical protein
MINYNMLWKYITLKYRCKVMRFILIYDMIHQLINTTRCNINNLQAGINGGVLVSVLASSVVDRGFKPKTIKLVFVASPLSTQH